jgi:hypothetical protein
MAPSFADDFLIIDAAYALPRAAQLPMIPLGALPQKAYANLLVAAA